MFGNIKKDNLAQIEINNLRNRLRSSEERIAELTTFYEETKDKEISRLTLLVDSLTKENTTLRDAKNAARLELDSEFKEQAKILKSEYELKVSTIEQTYSNRLQNETELYSNKIDLMERQISIEVENRTKESVGEIKMLNKELQRDADHSRELMQIYKQKFEGGKIELGADEIKGILLSANPNGDRIIDRMGQL